MERIKKKFPIIIIWGFALFLFILPFFWFKPGEMDLGGDSSRLYFYNPLAYLQNYALYAVSPSGFGFENIGYFMIPFVLFLSGILYVIRSSTVLIAAYHGISFAVAFLSIYGIVKELLAKEKETKSDSIINTLSSFLAGCLYVLSQISITGWDKVLVTHNQFFLNPLVFFLFLKYIKKNNIIYLLFFLIVSFIFSPNFSFAAAPGFFSFYPLGILFLLSYQFFILKKTSNSLHIIVTITGLVLLQAFHIFPQIVSMFSAGSVLNTTIFSNSGKLDRGLGYFSGIVTSIKVSLNVLLLPQMTALYFFAFIFIFLPLVMIVGLLFNKSKTVLLTAFFFIIVIFFASANITNIGLEFYKSLFYLPGFAMFRNFYGQWQYVLLFFYVILFGQSLGTVLNLVKRKYVIYIISIIFILLILTSFPFLNGSLINPKIWLSKNTHIFMKTDSHFVKAISFMKSLPGNGRVLTLPLTDPGYQIIVNNNGAYEGPSTVAYLAGKQDFAGLTEFGLYSQDIADLVKTNNIADFQKILGLLNIEYIFYNSDESAYEKNFPSFPYQYVKNFFPQNQEGYREFLSKLDISQIYSDGNKYFIYKVNSSFYHPIIFTTTKINYFDKPLTEGDLSILLPYITEKADVIAYFNKKTAPPIVSTIFSELTPISRFLDAVKNPDIPLILQNSFAKTKPSSILYIPSIVKENYSISKADNNNSSYIQQRLFYAAKRIDELEQWGKEIPINKASISLEDIKGFISTKQDKSLLELRDWEYFNSWDFLISRYYQYIQESIEKVNSASENEQWKFQQKFLINEYLFNHRKRYVMLLSNLEKADMDRSILINLVNAMFDDLQILVNMPIDTSTITYNISGSLNEKSVFLIKKFPLEQLQDEAIHVRLGNNVLEQNVSQPYTDWLVYSPVSNFDTKDKTLSIQRENPKNLLDSSEFISLQNSSHDTNISEIFKKTDGFSLRNGLLWKINNWIPRSHYLLSFDYNTGELQSSVKIFERDDSGQTHVLVENALQSGRWQKYQAVVITDKYGNNGYIQLGAIDNGDPLSTLRIRNISFTYMPDPTILLFSQQNQQYQNPEITFKKINPTKYVIHIANATDPYALVLNEAYNERWKLFLERGNTVLSKFGIENITNKSILGTTHSSSTGYDNVWFVSPNDIYGKQEYTLVAEMTTQWYFSIGLLFSLVAFCIVCLLTIILLPKYIWRKK